MAIQEEKLSVDLDRISRNIAACKTRQFTAFRKIVAVLGLITWKVSTVSAERRLLLRLLRSVAGVVCMTVTGIGVSIMHLYHTRIRRMNRSRDKILDDLERAGEPLSYSDPRLREYSGPRKGGPCVREPAVETYEAVCL